MTILFFNFYEKGISLLFIFWNFLYLLILRVFQLSIRYLKNYRFWVGLPILYKYLKWWWFIRDFENSKDISKMYQSEINRLRSFFYYQKKNRYFFDIKLKLRQNEQSPIYRRGKAIKKLNDALGTRLVPKLIILISFLIFFQHINVILEPVRAYIFLFCVSDVQ